MTSTLANVLARAVRDSGTAWTAKDDGNAFYLNSEPPGRYAQVWADHSTGRFAWEIWVAGGPLGANIDAQGDGIEPGAVLADAQRALGASS